MDVIDLPWLPEAHDDFRQQVRRLTAPDSDQRALARRLAGYRLTNNQLHTLGKVIAKLGAEHK